MRATVSAPVCLRLPRLDETYVDDRRAVGVQVQRVRRDVVRAVVLIDERHASADRNGDLRRRERIVRRDRDGRR